MKIKWVVDFHLLSHGIPLTGDLYITSYREFLKNDSRYFHIFSKKLYTKIEKHKSYKHSQK